MSNKYNQFIAQAMRSEKPDTEKLIGLASKIRQKYHYKVDREPIILFNRETNKIIDIKSWISAKEFADYAIHVPDLVIWIKNKPIILEIDGLVHDTNTNAKKKDKRRNYHYLNAGLNYIIINELKVAEKNGATEMRGATVNEIFEEFELIHNV